VSRSIDVEVVVEIARRKAAGEISHDEAVALVDDLSEPDDGEESS
jgi:hypothetical protein